MKLSEAIDVLKKEKDNLEMMVSDNLEDTHLGKLINALNRVLSTVEKEIPDTYEEDVDYPYLCPICKEKANIEREWISFDTVGYYIKCQECGLRTETVRNISSALELWNTRVSDIM